MSVTYDAAFKKTLLYFNNDELATKVWLDKYALRDNELNLLEETPTDMHWRLAKEFARIEQQKFKTPYSAEFIFSLFDKFKFLIPQGSPMYGIGNDYTYQSLGNCFTLGEHPYDSYGGILYADQMLVQLSKRRCGVGLCLDKIRPKGMITRNAAKTTDGIGVFMHRFSNSIREVAQSGRRGALLQGLSVHHPEIQTFINIKRDLTKVTGANISVLLTDEFMQAVKDDKEYQQRWPVDGTPQFIKYVKASFIWNQIIDSAWTSAEPGLLFLDRARSYGLAHQYALKDKRFADIVTNPCQPPWAKVLTKNGIRQFKDINIGDEIWSETGWTKIINKSSNGIKKVYGYRTTFGVFYGTENHRIISKGCKIKVKDANSIDILRGIDNHNITLNPQDIMDGLVIGDGTKHKASNDLILLCIGNDDQDYFSSEIANYIIKYRPGIGDKEYEINTSIKKDELLLTFERTIPQRFIEGHTSKVAGFLRGLYSANGSVCGERVTLKSSSFNLVEQVQLMLSSLGIASYYTTNKSSKVKFNNGEFLCKESYDLNISRDRAKFANKIGFIQKYKIEKLNKLLNISSKKEKINKDIIEIEYLGEEEVFDITVDNNTHTYWTGGLNVSNCGELWIGLDSCRLFLINLFNYVKNPFTKQAKFDTNLFTEHTMVAQRLMDDMVDLEIEKIERIIDKVIRDPEPDYIKRVELDMWQNYKETAILGRRTGLGITALGDTLSALNIKYGNDESIEKTEEIYKQLAISSMLSSCLIAGELGAFPLYNKSLEQDHPFLENLFKTSDVVKVAHNKHGRRNISLTTTAPAGTVSVLSQTTSGIEPAYLLEYKRKRKISNDAVKYDFIDAMGDKWEENIVYHHHLKTWMKITGETDIKKSPYWGATSNDIDWEKSVDIQAAAQKWITHSISKTCNIPNNASKELVSNIYMSAWEKGCKGFTVYRDGCRDGVLTVLNAKTKETISYNDAPKRPKELLCKVFHVTKDRQEYFILIGYLDKHEPFECFAGKNNNHVINKKVTEGKIIKLGRGKYRAEFNDNTELSPLRAFIDPEEEILTRMVSMSLRHGAKTEHIVHQLEKSSGDLQSLSKAISRALKFFVKDGVIVSGEECPDCKSQLIRQEGCRKCSQCAYSAC